GSNLDMERPTGVTGGRNGAGFAGILFDTRDDEQNTHSGFLVQVAARVARPWTASQFSYQGVTFGTRIFFSLWTPRLVLALHGEADPLWGDVPFWEWNQIGGISSVEGLGGLDTVRGVPRNRYGGNTKVLGNVELRWATVEIPWGPAPLQIGLSGFLDTGRVWQPGQPNGRFFDASEWHSGAGGGLRLMRRAAVVRADFGVGWALKRPSIYVAFGELFGASSAGPPPLRRLSVCREDRDHQTRSTSSGSVAPTKVVSPLEIRIPRAPFTNITFSGAI